MTKITAAQQKVIDGLKAGKHLSMQHTKYGDGSELFNAGGFAGERRSVPAKTILSLIDKGLIKETSREKTSSITFRVVYQLA